MTMSSAILQLDTAGALTRTARSGAEQEKGADLFVIILVSCSLPLLREAG